MGQGLTAYALGSFRVTFFMILRRYRSFYPGLVFSNDILSPGNLTLGSSRLQFMLCSSLVTINWVEHLDLDTIARNKYVTKHS